MTGRGRLYVIVGPQAAVGAVETARVCAALGVADLQLRDKRPSDLQRLDLASAVAAALVGTSTRFWVNDRVDIGSLAGAHGVHLGQGDLPPRLARVLAGPACLIGRSAHSPDQVRDAQADPAVDWIAMGPVFPTSSKADAEPCVGLSGVAAARERTTKPLVAIGGLGAGNIASVLAAGADHVAVLSAVACAPDTRALERNILALVAACAANP